MSCASPMWGVASILGVLLVVSPRSPLFAGPSLRQRADREAKPRRRTERDRGPSILLRGPSAAGSENPPIPLVAGRIRRPARPASDGEQQSRYLAAMRRVALVA